MNIGDSEDDIIPEKQPDPNDVTVRGRAFDQTKPETFNQVICFSSHSLQQ